MITTGRADNDGRTYTRRLLAEYLPDLGLERYIQFDHLKAVTKAATDAPAGSEERDAAAADFFRLLKLSFNNVKAQLHSMEVTAQAAERRIRRIAADDLREDQSVLIETYTQLHRVDRYRALNVLGFAKILEKFLKRVAVSSLELQAKVRKSDGIISSSILSIPTYPTASAKEHIAATYSVVTGKTLEEAFADLDRAVEANPLFTTRILPFDSAHHYRERSKHQQMQGTFAAKVIPGTSNPTIAKHICAVMRSGAKVKANVGRFANGEVSLSLGDAVRADDVYIVQSMTAGGSAKGSNMSAAIVELMLAIQTATLASAARVTAVIPYMAYSKRTNEIAALAEMVELMGCHRVITLDLFAEQVEGMFSIPVDNIWARDEFAAYLLTRFRATGNAMDKLVVVSSNADNVGRARSFADRLMKLGKLDPVSQFVQVASAVKRVGSDCIDVAGVVEGRECIIVDNVVDEALAVSAVADRLKAMGATRITLIATHALLSGDGPSRIEHGCVDEVIVSDSINQDELLRNANIAKKLRVLPVAPLLAGVIDCVHSNINAVSELLEK